MTDETKTVTLAITDPYQTEIVFVNEVVGRGILNGVVNLTFATARFSPRDGEIDPDLVITARLRMDMVCVQQLRDICDGILSSSSKPN